MSYEVRTENVPPRPLAAIRGTTPRQQLGTEIRRLLDVVWPAVREQCVRTGHNVVLYHGADGGTLLIEAGVETFTRFVDRGDVRCSSTSGSPASSPSPPRARSPRRRTMVRTRRWLRRMRLSSSGAARIDGGPAE